MENKTVLINSKFKKKLLQIYGNIILEPIKFKAKPLSSQDKAFRSQRN